MLTANNDDEKVDENHDDDKKGRWKSDLYTKP